MNKEAMRAEARMRLAALTSAERHAASAIIAAHVWEIPEIASARTLMIYSPIQTEVDTAAIAAEATRRGIDLVYPRCLPETRAMSTSVIRQSILRRSSVPTSAANCLTISGSSVSRRKATSDMRRW